MTHYGSSFPLDGYNHKHRQDVTVYWKTDLDDHISIPEYKFNIEKAAYKEMLNLYMQKKELIVNDDIDDLNSLILKENDILKKIKIS